jgi:hypothetical protein
MKWRASAFWKRFRPLGMVRSYPDPILTRRRLIAKNAMNGAQLLRVPDGSSGLMSGPLAYI